MSGRVPGRATRAATRRRAISHADVRPGRVLRPGPMGTWVLHDATSEASADTEYDAAGPGGGASYAPGQIVPVGSHLGGTGRLILGRTPREHRGGSDYPPRPDVDGPLETRPVLIRIDPPTIRGGESATFTLSGALFVEGMQVYAMRPAGDSDSYVRDDRVTVAVTAVTSDTQATATITCDAAVEVGERIDFSTRPAIAQAPWQVELDLLEVLAPASSEPPAYLMMYAPSGSVGDVHFYTCDSAGGDRQDLESLSVSVASTAPTIGQYIAPSLAVLDDEYPAHLWVAWVAQESPSGTWKVYAFDAVTGASTSVPLVAGFPRHTYAWRGNGVFIYHEIVSGAIDVYALTPITGVSTLIRRVTSSVTIRPELVAYLGDELVFRGGSFLDLTRVPLDGSATSTVFYGSWNGPSGATPHTRSGRGAAPSGIDEVTPRAVGPIWYGDTPVTLSIQDPPSGLQGTQTSPTLNGSAVDTLLASAPTECTARVNAAGSAAFVYPLAGGGGLWIAHNADSTDPANSTTPYGFTPPEHAGPGTAPHAVVPLGAPPPWE